MSIAAHEIRTQWLTDRKTYIGASEAATALGLNPYRSPIELWGEKTGRLVPENLDDNEAVQLGIDLEPIVLKHYHRRTGRHVYPAGPYQTIIHPDYPWLGATLDARQWKAGEGGVRVPCAGVLDAKTTSAWNLAQWQDDAPMAYRVQLQVQMACTGYTWGSLACLVGGQKLKWFDEERNESFIAVMIERLAEFWQCVLTETMPEVDNSEATAQALAKLYPMDTGETVYLGPEFAEIDNELQAAKATIKTYETLARGAENKLKAAIGTASIAKIPGCPDYTYRAQTRKAYEVSETTFRVLRRAAK